MNLIQFRIQLEGHDKPITIYVMKLLELTVEKIFGEMMKILKFTDQIEIDSTFTLNIVAPRRPVGAGRVTNMIHIHLDQLKSNLNFPSTAIQKGFAIPKPLFMHWIIQTTVEQLLIQSGNVTAMLFKQSPCTM